MSGHAAAREPDSFFLRLTPPCGGRSGVRPYIGNGISLS